MNTLRVYGLRPYRVAVIHGGPGAPGELAPVARELSTRRGILEPLQTADSIAGQIQEMYAALNEYGDLPAILVGWSWGAWLSYILSAEYPALVRKLILISSGPFEEKYAASIMPTRLSRLNPEERARATTLLDILGNPDAMDSTLMAEFGELISRADSWNLLPHISEPMKCEPAIYRKVWEQASGLRRSSRLLELGKRITCPVLAIHGDYDPHPAEGVREPLSRVLKEFRFILLERCGHQPWYEREAVDRFYAVLKQEIEIV